MSASKKKQMKIAIILSTFYPKITEGLHKGALKIFKSHHILSSQIDSFTVPGTFEIPQLAKKLAQTKKYAGILCLGSVIEGETMHFQCISFAATMGILQASLDSGIPISFGVLTTYNLKQAQKRSANNSKNKGAEAATALLKMIQIFQK